MFDPSAISALALELIGGVAVAFVLAGLLALGVFVALTWRAARRTRHTTHRGDA